MNPSYSGVNFMLHLPTCVIYEDHIGIDYKFIYRDVTEEISLYKSILKCDGEKYEDILSCTRFDITRKNTKAKLSFDVKAKSYNFNLEMLFYSNNGNKIIVLFSFANSNKATLLDVSKSTMSQVEMQEYRELTNKKSKTTVDYNIKKDEKSIKHVRTDIHIDNAKKIPGMNRYLEALKIEKKFLMNEGGRKYKVTNGKLISVVKGIYSYIFDLDAELHISDDAPIKISTGMFDAKGSVLMCEDFQMIIELGSHIGDRVSSAVVSVEPWKLLEALEEKMERAINIGCGNIAYELVEKGPTMATNKSIETISKGQDEVIERSMNEPVCIVWGPPGTGKTYTMSEIAINFIKQGKKVLIVSHSNVSVDGVVKKIQELLDEKHENILYENGKILRYGYVRDEELKKNHYVNSFYYTVHKNRELNKKIDELQEEYDREKHINGLGTQKIINIRKQIALIRTQIREQEIRYVESASVVATTISKVVIDDIFEDKQYDVVMFDEVSMAYVLQVVFASTYAKEHFICVGDFMQLAPIAQSKAKDILSEDIFSYLGITKYGEPYYHPWLVMLDEQRRMHPSIANFINKNVYKNMLKNHESTRTSRNEIVDSEMFEKNPINMIDMFGAYCAADKDDNNSRYNLLSAFMSFAMAIKTEPNVKTVSIITPYAAQTRLIRAMVLDYREDRETNIRCATVHQFQGSESDVVIFDAVESYPKKKPGFLMGKDSNSIMRLINVAVSRAKGKFVTIANRRFWNANFSNSKHTYYNLLEYIGCSGNVVQHMDNRSLESLIDNLSVDKGPEFYQDEQKSLEQLRKDIIKAKHKIVISLPSGNINSTSSNILGKMLDEAKSKGVMVLVKSNKYAELPESWKKYTWGTDNAIFPLLMIDDKVTWYGVPFATWEFELDNGRNGFRTVCTIACRIRGERTAEIIKSITDLEYIVTDGGKRLVTPKSDFNIKESVVERPRLSDYIRKSKICPNCKTQLEMIRGKSGKVVLWCKNCKKPHLLSPDDINHYICVENVRCPEHKSYIEARLGKRGLYIRCDRGHFLNPEDI